MTQRLSKLMRVVLKKTKDDPKLVKQAEKARLKALKAALSGGA